MLKLQDMTDKYGKDIEEVCDRIVDYGWNTPWNNWGGHHFSTTDGYEFITIPQEDPDLCRLGMNCVHGRNGHSENARLSFCKRHIPYRKYALKGGLPRAQRLQVPHLP